MSIDPGTQRLGWSVSEIYLEGNEIYRKWLGRGTVFRSAKGTALITNIAKEVTELQISHNVDTLVIEDYIYIPGHTSGIFAVPALIGVLKHEWFKRTGKEPIMVEASTWKQVVCGLGNANKMYVKDMLKSLIGPEIIEEVEEEFNQHALKVKQDPQDCFDAIAIDIYVFLEAKKFFKEREVSLYYE